MPGVKAVSITQKAERIEPSPTFAEMLSWKKTIDKNNWSQSVSQTTRELK